MYSKFQGLFVLFCFLFFVFYLFYNSLNHIYYSWDLCPTTCILPCYYNFLSMVAEEHSSKILCFD